MLQQNQLKNFIFTFLSSHPVGVLATADKHNHPYATAVHCTYNHKLETVFATDTKTKKFRNMVHNNRVMLCVCDPEQKASVQIDGHVTLPKPKSLNADSRASTAEKIIIKPHQVTLTTLVQTNEGYKPEHQTIRMKY